MVMVPIINVRAYTRREGLKRCRIKTKISKLSQKKTVPDFHPVTLMSHCTFGSGSVMSELLVQYAGLDRASGGRVT